MYYIQIQIILLGAVRVGKPRSARPWPGFRSPASDAMQTTNYKVIAGRPSIQTLPDALMLNAIQSNLLDTSIFML